MTNVDVHAEPNPTNVDVHAENLTNVDVHAYSSTSTKYVVTYLFKNIHSEPRIVKTDLSWPNSAGYSNTLESALEIAERRRTSELMQCLREECDLPHGCDAWVRDVKVFAVSISEYWREINK